MKVIPFIAVALASTAITPIAAQTAPTESENSAPGVPAPTAPQTQADALAPAAAAADSTADEKDNKVGNEVVVTAQRRAQRLVDVPITITSATNAQLTAAGVQTTLDIYKVAPAVQVTHNGVWIEPAIRGVTSRVGENSVAVYVDGIYNPSKVSAATEFSNVQQVDVLKGPQGTLFGRNATGGAILITTRDPSQDLQVNLGAGLEERDGRFLTGYVSNGITENLAFDVSGYYRKNDGWMRQGANPVAGGFQPIPAGTPLNPVKRSGIRSKLLWTPGTARITLTGEHGYLSDPGAVTYQTQSNTLVAPGVYPIIPYVAYANQVPINRAKWDSATLKLEQDLGDAFKFTSATAYRRETNFISVDVDQTLQQAPNITASWDSTQRTLSQEFNLGYTSDRIQAVAGLFLYRDKFMKDYISVEQVARQNVTAAAPFVDVTYKITDALSVIGGLRYSYEKRTFYYNRPIANGPTVNFVADKSYNDFSPRGVIRYELAPNTNVYASYSKGFKSGLFNTDATGLTARSNPAAQPLEPERMDAFEVGYKMSNRVIDLAVATYYYKWKNIQVSRYTNQNTIYENAAEAEIYGLEGQLGIRLSPNFNIQANGAYTHGRYTDFPNSSASVPVNPADPNSPLVVVVSQDVSGNRLIRTPDWSGNLAFNYTIDTSVGQFRISPSVYYTSRFAPNSPHLSALTGRPDRETPPRALVNAQITYAPNDQISISAYARNLLNKEYYADLDVNTLGYYGLYGEPQTFGLRVDFKY